MNKLDKTQTAERDRLVAALRAAETKIVAEVEAFNKIVAEAFLPMEQAVEAYNALLQEARGLAENVSSEAQEEFDNRSEKWQESERGQSFNSWIQEWTCASFNDAEVCRPDEIDPPDLSAADELEALPDEPNYGD